MNAEEAWESQIEQIGEAAHKAWKSYMIASGYADHVFDPEPRFEYDNGPSAVHFGYTGRCQYKPYCSKREYEHHPDMVPWADLPENKRGKYLEPVKAVFLATYAEGYEIGVGDALAARQIKKDEAHLHVASTTRIHTKRNADLRRSQLAEEYPIVKDLLDEIEDLNTVVGAAREVDAVVPFLLSCIACGESLSAEEEAEIRAKRATLAAALAGQPTADPRDAVVEAAGALLAVCDGCETCYYAKEHTTLTAALEGVAE